jgi:hypothetical protein
MTTKSKADVSAYTAQQRKDELFRRGILAPWKLHAGQKLMYEAIKSSPAQRFVVNAARRLGKSYMLSVIALEHALQNPGSQIKFAAPNQKMARKIIFPLFKQILLDCPKHLQPKFRVHDGEYEFQNGASITVCGTEMGQVDGLRGTACDLALLDECGFMSDLQYVIDSIITPMFLTRPEARMILASTPPISPDHPFVKVYMEKAIEDGAYKKFDIYSNPLITPERIQEFIKEAGGEHTTTWRREYLAEVVTESENAIFPEAQNLDALVYELPRPKFFVPFVAVDLGYVDFTGAIFGYYDFLRNRVVIEDELLFNRCTSEKIVAQITQKERELWGDVRPRTRVVDGPSLAIADLNETYGFSCRTPEKSDLTANINRVRIDINNSALAIHPRCTKLIGQVKYATWNAQRNGFARSSSGHYDLAAALIYLCKHIDRTTNPVPADYGYDYFNDFGFPRRHASKTADALAAMFPRRVPIRKPT